MSLPDLNRSELDVMNVLWDTSPRSAREIHEDLAERLGWAYTTTRTVVDRLVDKGAVEKERLHGIYVYRPAVSKPQGIARLVADFSRRVARVPVTQVVSFFAESEALTRTELRELRQLLGELDREAR